MPHILEKIDYDADTFIVNQDAVLLRLHDKHHIWLPPGGHIELDEEPAEAAVREVKEEVGLDVTLVGAVGRTFTDDGSRELLMPRFMNRQRINPTHEHISFVFFARSDSRQTTQGETERSDAIRWFTETEVNDPAYGVCERVKYYALKALAELGSTK